MDSCTTVPKAAEAAKSTAVDSEAQPVKKARVEDPSSSTWYSCGDKPPVHGPADEDGYISVVAEAKEARAEFDKSGMLEFERNVNGTYSADVPAMISKLEVQTELALGHTRELYSMIRTKYLPAMRNEFYERMYNFVQANGYNWRFDLLSHWSLPTEWELGGRTNLPSPRLRLRRRHQKSLPFEFACYRNVQCYPRLIDVLSKRHRRCAFDFWCRWCDYYETVHDAYTDELCEFSRTCEACDAPALVCIVQFDGHVAYYSDLVDLDAGFSA